jgi:hypothetical protein
LLRVGVDGVVGLGRSAAGREEGDKQKDESWASHQVQEYVPVLTRSVSQRFVRARARECHHTGRRTGRNDECGREGELVQESGSASPR